MDMSEVARMKLQTAYDFLRTIPESKFVPGLDCFYDTEDSWRELSLKDTSEKCGTLACGAGWLALHPAFQARILDWRLGQADQWAQEHFGEDAFEHLFAERGDSPFDAEWEGDVSDKALLLYRIRRHRGEEPFEAINGAMKDSL